MEGSTYMACTLYTVQCTLPKNDLYLSMYKRKFSIPFILEMAALSAWYRIALVSIDMSISTADGRIYIYGMYIVHCTVYTERIRNQKIVFLNDVAFSHTFGCKAGFR